MAPSSALAGRVADKVPAILVYLESNLRILFASEHTMQMLGYTPGEILGRPLADFVDARTLRYAQAHVAAIERGDAVPREYVMRHKDGSRKYCQVHAVADRDASSGDRGYFACISDISSARAAREKTRRTRDRLGKALERGRKRSRQALVTHAEHELRTPLASVIAALELLREMVQPGPAADGERFVGMALENAHRLSRRVERLFEVERIELGELPAEGAAVNLAKLAACAVERAHADATRHGVRLAGAYDESDAWVCGEPERLRQAIGYLLGNAISRVLPGGEVAVKVRADERTVTLAVWDGGPAGADRQRVQRSAGGAPRPDAGTDVTLGSGLGLCIAKAIVARLGGTLGHVGRRGRGTLIHVTLPRASAPKAA